jgi:hypothetical protein
MLTHVHMVIYTWWCWHICQGGRVWGLERGLGFLSPSCRACLVGFGVFVEMKCLFFHCAECENRRWSRASVSRSLDADISVRCFYCKGARGRSGHRCVWRYGIGHWPNTVQRPVALWCQQPLWTLCTERSGIHWPTVGRVRWAKIVSGCLLECIGRLASDAECWASDASGARWNDHWTLNARDTWRDLIHRTLLSAFDACASERPVPPIFAQRLYSKGYLYIYLFGWFWDFSLDSLNTWDILWARELPHHSSPCLVAYSSEIEWDSSALLNDLHLVALDLWVGCGFLVTLGCFPTS